MHSQGRVRGWNGCTKKDTSRSERGGVTAASPPRVWAESENWLSAECSLERGVDVAGVGKPIGCVGASGVAPPSARRDSVLILEEECVSAKSPLWEEWLEKNGPPAMASPIA